jgi:hypothetical protein
MCSDAFDSGRQAVIGFPIKQERVTKTGIACGQCSNKFPCKAAESAIISPTCRINSYVNHNNLTLTRQVFKGANMNPKINGFPVSNLQGNVASARRADEMLVQTFAKIDVIALGLSCGVVCSLGLLAATVILVIKGGDPIGPNLSLLAQYFPGYTVTWTGSIVGCAYGFVTGFVAGGTLAFARNFSLAIYAYGVKLRASLAGNHFLDRFDS